MALPIGHSCCGLVFGILRFVPKCGSLQEVLQFAWTRRAELFICMLIANAPDFDFLFGLITSSLNNYHHMATHTLVWTLLAAFCIWLYGKFALKSPPVLAFWFVFLLLASHLVLDMFMDGAEKPIGSILAWPFSEQYWHLSVSIFPDSAKKNIMNVPSLHNLKRAEWELVISLPLLFLAVLSKVWRFPGRRRVNIT